MKIDGVAYTSDDLPYSDGGTGVLCVSDWTPVSSIIRRLDAHDYDFRDDGGQRDANQGVLVVRRPIDRRVERSGVDDGDWDLRAHGQRRGGFRGQRRGIDAVRRRARLASTRCAASSSHDPGTPTASEKKWCEQCSYLGEMHAACVAQMTNEGFSFTRAGVVEACRSALSPRTDTTERFRPISRKRSPRRRRSRTRCIRTAATHRRRNSFSSTRAPID